jgi:choline dehydrogenase
VGAREEVIVCGGAINAPQLLMLSGVGPADHLADHDIEVVQDLSGVGRNLQDHLSIGCIYECEKPVTLDDADGVLNALRWFVFKSGPLTSNVAEVGGFFRSDADRPAPDLQFHFGRSYFKRHGFDNPGTGHAFSVGPTLLAPESAGRIELASADPLEDPLIDPQYLSEGDDLERLVTGLRRSREVCEQAPLDEYRGEEDWPGSDVTTDEELADFVRRRVETIYHPVGTCRMGDDDLAVVDDELRVHGVDGLRVVDASIMPTVPRGNTNIPTIMVAERAAEFVTG